MRSFTRGGPTPSKFPWSNLWRTSRSSFCSSESHRGFYAHIVELFDSDADNLGLLAAPATRPTRGFYDELSAAFVNQPSMWLTINHRIRITALAMRPGRDSGNAN